MKTAITVLVVKFTKGAGLTGVASKGWRLCTIVVSGET
jgi:hypothetical protein